jgi:hypothetical protein
MARMQLFAFGVQKIIILVLSKKLKINLTAKTGELKPAFHFLSFPEEEKAPAFFAFEALSRLFRASLKSGSMRTAS